jgi:hypothetical protein
MAVYTVTQKYLIDNSLQTPLVMSLALPLLAR